VSKDKEQFDEECFKNMELVIQMLNEKTPEERKGILDSFQSTFMAVTDTNSTHIIVCPWECKEERDGMLAVLAKCFWALRVRSFIHMTTGAGVTKSIKELMDMMGDSPSEDDKLRVMNQIKDECTGRFVCIEGVHPGGTFSRMWSINRDGLDPLTPFDMPDDTGMVTIGGKNLEWLLPNPKSKEASEETRKLAMSALRFMQMQMVK